MANQNATHTESASHVKHRTVEIDGIRIFYREAGPEDAPVVLLPHGYPSSSSSFAISCLRWLTAGAWSHQTFRASAIVPRLPRMATMLRRPQREGVAQHLLCYRVTGSDSESGGLDGRSSGKVPARPLCGA
jgi:hypothetical protein